MSLLVEPVALMASALAPFVSVVTLLVKKLLLARLVVEEKDVYLLTMPFIWSMMSRKASCFHSSLVWLC